MRFAALLACLVAALGLGLGLRAGPGEPAPAIAASVQELATLHASFNPDRLGASSTLQYSFTLSDAGGLPPPLTAITLQLPGGMSYLESTLGLALCKPAKLLALGARGCPVDSKLGHGSASVEIPFGKTAGHESPQIELFMGPPRNGNTVILFYVNGQKPVYAQLVFSGEILPDSGRFGSQLATTVPLVSSITEGPDVSIVHASATIGPEGILYQRRAHGKLRYFHPHGISVPERCPQGGFPFVAEFTFQGGARAQASTTVPCPPARRRRRGQRRAL